MTRDRDVAQALSDGLNCIAAIVGALDADAPAFQAPRPEWAATLHAMEGALTAIASKGVTTSLVVGEEECERVRRLRALVSSWATARLPPQELRAVAESVLAIFDLGGSRSPHAPSSSRST